MYGDLKTKKDRLSKSKVLQGKMTSHEAVREWKKTGKKPEGLKKVCMKCGSTSCNCK